MKRQTRYGCLTARLLANSKFDGDCLVWQGQTCKHGYGRINFRAGARIVHRPAHHVAYSHFTGLPVPPKAEGEYAHTCSNAGCINNKHASFKTHIDNCAERGGMFSKTDVDPFDLGAEL